MQKLQRLLLLPYQKKISGTVTDSWALSPSILDRAMRWGSTLNYCAMTLTFEYVNVQHSG